MNVKEFKERVKKARIKITPKKSYGGLEWSDWYTIAEMTNKIYYGCDFQDGICTKLNEDLKTNPNASKMCCCNQCGNHIGYLNYIQNNSEVLKMISSLFHPVLGFWKKDTGCSLPRKYRSSTCLSYRCDLAKKRYDIVGVRGIVIKFIHGSEGYLTKEEIYVIGKTLLKIPVY